MRFVHVYLIAYFLLVLGAGLTLWQAGALAHIPAVWIALAAIIALGLGLALVVTSRTPTTT
jgi:hypothetical protein